MMEQSFKDIQFDDIVGKQFIDVERTKLDDIINDIFPKEVPNWEELQEQEENDMFDPEFELILSSLDKKLEQMEDEPENLRHYLIYIMLRDPDDLESEKIIQKYEEEFGKIDSIIH